MRRSYHNSRLESRTNLALARFLRGAFLTTAALLLAGWAFRVGEAQDDPTRLNGSRYGETPRSSDGIGKTYLGREIAQVMGHQGADWLDRPERANEEGTNLLVAELGRRLKPDAVVADIGAGSGYFSFLIAPLVPKGRVLAEDIEPEMLKIIAEKKKRLSSTSPAGDVITLLGTTTDPKLPVGGVDAVLLVDTYHEWDHPYEMMQAIRHGLKPGGRVFQLEYRAEDPDVPILPHHKMTEAQARKEMSAAGFSWIETVDRLPRQHLMIYEKPIE